MAELKKVNDFHYEAPEMDQPTVATEQDRKMQYDTLHVHTLLPKKKLKNVSLLEKLIGVVCVAYLAKYQSLSTVIKRGDNRGNTLWENVPHNSPLRGVFLVFVGLFYKKHSKNLVIITFFVG